MTTFLYIYLIGLVIALIGCIITFRFDKVAQYLVNALYEKKAEMQKKEREKAVKTSKELFGDNEEKINTFLNIVDKKHEKDMENIKTIPIKGVLIIGTIEWSIFSWYGVYKLLRLLYKYNTSEN